ncbi:hypothetical protein PLICRDRAFT_85758, partial [Plicaturopsis crispa FD-325 SS-3]
KRFGQLTAKPASTPLSSSVTLSAQDSPTTTAEKDEMAKFPYLALIGALLYVALCT